MDCCEIRNDKRSKWIVTKHSQVFTATRVASLSGDKWTSPSDEDFVVINVTDPETEITWLRGEATVDAAQWQKCGCGREVHPKHATFPKCGPGCVGVSK